MKQQFETNRGRRLRDVEASIVRLRETLEERCDQVISDVQTAAFLKLDLPHYRHRIAKRLVDIKQVCEQAIKQLEVNK